MILLDTSAILAHWFAEPGHEIVANALASRQAWVAAPTWFELRIRTARELRLIEALEGYRALLVGTVDITREVAEAAFLIRRASGERIPAMDSLIAGAAKVRGFRLIHRDKHMARISSDVLQQAVLPRKA